MKYLNLKKFFLVLEIFITIITILFVLHYMKVKNIDFNVNKV